MDDGARSKTLEQAADRTIALFNTWFQALPNEPLAKPERAILKTFLWFIAQNGTSLEQEGIDLHFGGAKSGLENAGLCPEDQDACAPGPSGT